MDRPQVFISWSGDGSREVGQALRDWLPHLFNFISIWISTEDLNKGTRWLSEIVKELQASQFGVVCLTQGNLENPWILFEAGAISNLPQSRVFTLLHGVEPAQVRPPLGMFNHTTSRREDIQRMITSLNGELGEMRVPGELLASAFEKFWPDLERRLRDIHVQGPAVAAAAVQQPQNQTEIINEILTVVRDTSRSLAGIVSSDRREQTESRRIRDIVMSRFSEKLRELGVRYQQMGMPVEVSGGITIKLDEREIEVPIGDAADFVDGIIKPVDFLKLIGTSAPSAR
jgi:hypothetical protein